MRKKRSSTRALLLRRTHARHATPRLASSRHVTTRAPRVAGCGNLAEPSSFCRVLTVATDALMENEYELKRFVLSALKYSRYQSFIAGVSVEPKGQPPRLHIGGADRSQEYQRHRTCLRPLSFLHTAAASGDPTPSAAYTAGG